MAKNYGIHTLAQPTGLVAAAQAGGSLAPNTTYYYKIVAVNRAPGMSLDIYTFSPRSATVNATTTAVNRSIKLDWNDPGIAWNGSYSGHLILRNTADSFPDTLDCAVVPYAGAETQGTTFTDDGSRTPDGTCNFIGGLPTIYSWGDEYVSMADLYDEDVAQGWGRIQPCLDTTYMEFSTAFNDEGVGYFIHANLVIGYDGAGNAEGWFRHRRGPIIVYGAFGSTSAAIVWFGNSANSDKTANTWDRVQLVTQSPYYNASVLSGTLYLYGLSCTIGARDTWGEYQHRGWNNPYSGIYLRSNSPNSEVIDCDFYPMGNGFKVAGQYAIFRGNRFGGCQCATYDATLEGVITSQSDALGCRHIYNPVFVAPTNYYATYDVIWRTRYSAFMEDPTFDSTDQSGTTNHPYLFLAYDNTLEGSFTFAVTLQIRVQNLAGNPLAGVSVSVIDANGQGCLYVDSEATLAETVSAGETEIDVSDGTKFGLGDYIRWEYGHEVMRVSNIAADTLTVSRGEKGTKDVRYDRDGDRVLKLTASLTTGADGTADCGQMIRYVLYPAPAIDGVWTVAAAWPATHVADGYLTQVDHTPHRITLSKAGYTSKTLIWDMSRRRDEIETLLETPPPVYESVLGVGITEDTLSVEVTEEELEVSI